MEVARVAVKLQPRGARDELLGFVDDVLRARVSAPPVDGKANKALCRLIAARVGVAPSRVAVVRGARSREKLVEVRGVDATALPELLAG
ncbi:MAG TPA: DUF167 domain-containing protein [Solirubrobacterales bacterium]|nr:DUF167 domain-containing protein [Solirubrobacterales bacterium]